jgi:limonene-1,2-epoxide hydrolase
MADPTGNGVSTAVGQQQEDRAASAVSLVERFLDLLCAEDIDGAAELLAPDVKYTNVGLPSVHGRARVRRLLQRTLGLPGAGFEAYTHTISVSGSSVMTERTDVLKFRPLRVQFWVCGRFDVEDGQIVLWRDYFDQVNIWMATLRGLLGTVLPAVRAKPPS